MPIITPLMQRVERTLARHASAYSPMPNNPILGELAGGHGRSSAYRALRRLEKLGRIRVERKHGSRRVTVVATGQTTDWGNARKGHSNGPRGNGGNALEIVGGKAEVEQAWVRCLKAWPNLKHPDWIR